MIRRQMPCWLVVGALLLTPAAEAQFFETIYRGLDILATPSGSPVQSTGDGGLRNDARFGRVRVVPNQFGNGYRMEFDRTFGTDNFGRPETFDFGSYEIALDGSLQSTAQYTTRGIPAVNLNSVANNLNYELRAKSGAQDVLLRGTFNLQQQIEVNRFGFYTLRMNVGNTNSQVLLDGVLVDGDPDTNFDIGPINVKGNIFVDGISALLTSFGVNTNEIDSIFDSPIDRINDSIQQQLTAKIAEVAGVQAVVDLGVALNVPPAGSLNGSIPGYVGPSQPPAGPEMQIPEPSTLALLLAGGLTLFRRRF